jgi:hypothetical protein
VNGYVCVFRHVVRPRDVARTATLGHPIVKSFLDQYTEPRSVLDWGDDPAFFSAGYFLGDLRLATWGVCRARLRAKLKAGDFVVFFCAKPDPHRKPRCEYYFIGVGTVTDVISREQLWSEIRYAQYRQFLNVLAKLERQELTRHEYFQPGHPDDWRKRLRAYVLFGGPFTFFNVTNPPQVAAYEGSLPEEWLKTSPVAEGLAKLLFGAEKNSRRLRTSHSRHAHAHLNLRTSFPDCDLAETRKQVLAIAHGAA